MLKKISFIVNGKPVSLEINVGETLLEVLRNYLGYTGVKQSCAVGECGTCTVLIDGTPIDSCIYLGVWADGKNITTVEGLAEDGVLTKVQRAFVEEGAVQCGFCTPGFILATTAMVESGKKYPREEIKKELSGNLCRCTGYENIIRAAEKALED